MSELYEKVYRRSPDTVAMPVKVAVPDPIHNSTKINDNGTYNVSSFAEAKVNVDGGGGGSGGDLEYIIENQTVEIVDDSSANLPVIAVENFDSLEAGDQFVIKVDADAMGMQAELYSIASCSITYLDYIIVTITSDINMSGMDLGVSITKVNDLDAKFKATLGGSILPGTYTVTLAKILF